MGIRFESSHPIAATAPLPAGLVLLAYVFSGVPAVSRTTKSKAAQGPAEEVCIDHGVGPVVEQLEDLSCVIETPDQERPLDIEDHQRVDKANPT